MYLSLNFSLCLLHSWLLFRKGCIRSILLSFYYGKYVWVWPPVCTVALRAHESHSGTWKTQSPAEIRLSQDNAFTEWPAMMQALTISLWIPLHKKILHQRLATSRSECPSHKCWIDLGALQLKHSAEINIIPHARNCLRKRPGWSLSHCEMMIHEDSSLS